jgi:predicted ester cyclase
MTREEHMALIRRFNDEVWTQGKLAAIDELFAADWVWHVSGSMPPSIPHNRDGLKQMVAGFRAAFADIHETMDEQVVDGDKVAWLWTFRGRHTGELSGIAPTGKQVVFWGIALDRFAGGKFVERWDSFDMLDLLMQLGAVPAPGPPAADTEHMEPAELMAKR